eukprot:357103-Chlamydomonas_euryale.AAC.3
MIPPAHLPNSSPSNASSPCLREVNYPRCQHNLRPTLPRPKLLSLPAPHTPSTHAASTTRAPHSLNPRYQHNLRPQLP